jgi:hypothetical protein
MDDNVGFLISRGRMGEWTFRLLRLQPIKSQQLQIMNISRKSAGNYNYFIHIPSYSSLSNRECDSLIKISQSILHSHSRRKKPFYSLMFDCQNVYDVNLGKSRNMDIIHIPHNCKSLQDSSTNINVTNWLLCLTAGLSTIIARTRPLISVTCFLCSGFMVYAELIRPVYQTHFENDGDLFLVQHTSFYFIKSVMLTGSFCFLTFQVIRNVSLLDVWT